jgi:hypothetical protein
METSPIFNKVVTELAKYNYRVSRIIDYEHTGTRSIQVWSNNAVMGVYPFKLLAEIGYYPNGVSYTEGCVIAHFETIVY